MSNDKSITKRVLIVDDNTDLLVTTNELMANFPVKCVLCESGNEAVETILNASKDNECFDLIILDLWVPRDKHGEPDRTLGLTLLLENVYYQIIPCGTPVIVYTNYPTYETCVKCIKAGAYDYLPKVLEDGIASEELLLRCKRLLFPEYKPNEYAEWIKERASQIREKYAGKYIAMIAASIATKARIKDEPWDGFVILESESKKALADKLLMDRVLRWEKPYVIDLTHK